MQPRAGEPLRIGARVIATGGTVRAFTLSYQLVEPGAYIRKEDPEYEKQWTPVPMHDDGKDGDTRAADSIFTAVLPAALSTQRRLIRYRITAEDTADTRTRAPAEDDACPNFADPQGPQTFAAVQWRVACIAAPGVPGHKDGARWRYEIEPVWTSAEIAPFANAVAIPAYSITSGMRCRARVRMKDDTGRWSRWSEAVEFTSGPSAR